MSDAKICILGGTGFVGNHLVAELTRQRRATVVLTRRRERHRALLVNPTCRLVQADIRADADLVRHFEGCEAVVNLVGILNETGGSGAGFEDLHANLPGRVARACVEAGVPRLLHMSSLGAGVDAPSMYLRTKGRGEHAAHATTDLAVTSFRPSVIFGPGDSFFNRFAQLLRISPLLLPLACPEARMAPVYVGDVVRAFSDSLADRATFGERYDLCGPRQYTLRELVEYTARVADLRRVVVGLGDGLSELQANILEHVPGKPFTRDNFLSLQVDSVCRGVNGLKRLGIEPIAVETVVPTYIGHRDRTGRFQRLRSHARRGS
jgi:NADH dehydrogenase